MANDIQSVKILESIKHTLGVTNAYDEFDSDIVMHINTVLANLIQMGVGPQEGFSIDISNTHTWGDFIGDDKKIEQVKTYVALKVRLMFDPPSNSIIVDSFNKTCSELEYRLYTEKGGY